MIAVIRRSEAVARLTAVADPRKRIEESLLQALRATMPPRAGHVTDLVRSMWDGDRY